MTAATSERNAELVAFIVNRCSGELGRTRLMKLLYLADYEARRFLGRPLSNLNYIWYHYGPYDSAVEAVVRDLKGRHAITETMVEYSNGQHGYIYSQGTEAIAPSFDPADFTVLSYVCDKYSRVDLRELLDDIVYQTEPMIAAKQKDARNPKLDMAVVNYAKGGELGVSFEVLLGRSWDLKGGAGLPHQEAMRRLEETLANVA